MIFLFLIHAEVQIVDQQLQELQETEEKIQCAITGKKQKAKTFQQLKLEPKTNCPAHYSGAKISIEQGGCPSGSEAGANMKQIRDDMEQQQHLPLVVACRHSHDVFESQNKLEDPGQKQHG